jgi:putative ABC transport system permease protein
MYFATFILKNLVRRPVRTVLTVLGLAVAVGSMVALLAVNDNVERAVTRSFTQRNVDLVVLQAGKSSDLNGDFSEWLVEKARIIHGVTEVDEATVDVLNMTRDSGATDPVMVQGWKINNQAFADIEVVAGRALRPDDHGKVMLGSTLAGNLKKGVGDTITIGDGNTFEVVGVYKSFVVFEDGAVTMLMSDAQKLTGKRVTGFSVKVTKTAPVGTPEAEAEVDRVKEAIKALRDPDDPTVRLDPRTPAEYVKSVTHLKIVRAMTWMVAVIAIVIGVISMLNTMVMSVLERTQEIGILRAVGWTKGRIVRMVLGEAMILGVLAAVVGTAGAYAGTHLLAQSPKVNGFIEPGVAPAIAAEGVAITAVIGLLGGLYPAVRAARLLPTEAIRHD